MASESWGHADRLRRVPKGRVVVVVRLLEGMHTVSNNQDSVAMSAPGDNHAGAYITFARMIEYLLGAYDFRCEDIDVTITYER